MVCLFPWQWKPKFMGPPICALSGGKAIWGNDQTGSNWALVSEPGFLDFQISRFPMLKFFFLLNHVGNPVVRHRGKVIKVLRRDPGRNGGLWGSFLVHWDSNLPTNVEKWHFWRPVRPDPAKARKKSCVWSVRSSQTPLDLPNFNLNYSFSTFCGKLDFPRFTNRSLKRKQYHTNLILLAGRRQWGAGQGGGFPSEIPQAVQQGGFIRLAARL